MFLLLLSDSSLAGLLPTYFHRTWSLSFCAQLSCCMVIHKLRISESEGFPESSAGKESACNAGDPGSIPGWGRSVGAAKGYPLQGSGLENSTDCIIHGFAKSRTRRGAFHCHCLHRKARVLPDRGPSSVRRRGRALPFRGPRSLPGSKPHPHPVHPSFSVSSFP